MLPVRQGSYRVLAEMQSRNPRGQWHPNKAWNDQDAPGRFRPKLRALPDRGGLFSGTRARAGTSLLSICDKETKKMPFKLRPCNFPAEYGTVAAILTAARPGVPTTEADLADRDGWMPPDSIRRRVVAEDGHGAAIGFAEAYRYPNTAEGKFYVNAAVLPAAQGQGAGTLLLGDVERFALAHGGNRLMGDVHDQDVASLAYMKRRGYVVERHGYDSVLQLAEFDPAPFAGLEVPGIRFFTLADAPGEETLQALYRLYSRTMVDIPGYEAKSFMTYETWQHLVLKGEGCRPDWVFVAADGDRLVGVTTMIVSGDHVYTNHTLVDRAHRGRGIALALKLLTVAAAQRYGAPCMRTGNDSDNGPMLAVNRKLGYRPLSGDYTVVRRV